MAGEPVLEIRDMLPLTDALILETERLRVVIRPSGTEPKLKCYLEFSAPASTGSLAAQRELAHQSLTLLKDDLRKVLALDHG